MKRHCSWSATPRITACDNPWCKRSMASERAMPPRWEARRLHNSRQSVSPPGAGVAHGDKTRGAKRKPTDWQRLVYFCSFLRHRSLKSLLPPREWVLSGRVGMGGKLPRLWQVRHPTPTPGMRYPHLFSHHPKQIVQASGGYLWIVDNG